MIQPFAYSGTYYLPNLFTWPIPLWERLMEAAHIQNSIIVVNKNSRNLFVLEQIPAIFSLTYQH